MATTVTGQQKFIGSDEREDYFVTGTAKSDTLIGNDGNDSIYGGDGNDSINGLGGSDVLAGGKGADKLTGGEGADIFVWNKGDGNDVITDYATEDIISIASASVTSISTNTKGDAIITIGNAKLTLTGGADKVISYVDAGGEHTWPETVTFTKKKVTLLDNYSKDSFDINEYKDGNYNTSVVTIDASAVEQDIAITGNGKANKITGSANDDTIYGGKGNDTLAGGEGSDVFVWNKGDGNDVITDYNMEDTISIASGVLSTSFGLKGNDVIATVSGKTITIKDGKGKYIHFVDASGNHVWYPEDPISAVVVSGKTVTIGEKYKGDAFDVTEFDEIPKNITKIDASEVTHALEITGNKQANQIVGTSEDDYINGGAGKDTIRGGEGDDTLEGGAGADSLVGGKGADVFLWNAGDGNDIIADYSADDGDVISVTSGEGKVTTNKAGNAILTVGKAKLTIQGGKGQTITWYDEKGLHTYPEVVKFSSDGKSASLLSAYTGDSFNINNYDSYDETVINIDASAVEQDIAITGNAKANKITGSANADSIIGGKGKDTLTGGEGADTFIWNSGDGQDVITDFSGKDGDEIVFTSGTATSVESGNDIILKNGKGQIKIQGGADEKIVYTDAKGEHTIGGGDPIILSGKTVTLTDAYADDSFKLTGYAAKYTIVDASAVEQDISITGNAKANKITGSANADTIIGGKAADTLDGGEGADLFVWNAGDGNDVILNYANEDAISIASAAVKYSNFSTVKSSNDVTLKIGSAKITIKDAKDKVVTVYDKDGKEVTFPQTVKLSSSNKVATLTDDYYKTEFVAGDYHKNIREINAEAVDHALSITGSGKADLIIGTDGDDTIIGGRGGDTLQGGNGADIFVYNSGDGNDVITDYAAVDKISIASGAVSDAVEVDGNDVIFDVNGGKIVVEGGKGKKITIIDKYGDSSSKRYTVSTMKTEDTWFTADDTNFDNADDQLSSIVKGGSAYSPVDKSAYSFETDNSYIPVIAQSDKK